MPASGTSRSTSRLLEEMKRFYVDLLGFAVEWEPDADNVYLSSGIDNLALHRFDGITGRPRTEGRPGQLQALDHLGLIVREAGRRRPVGGVSRERRRRRSMRNPARIVTAPGRATSAIRMATSCRSSIIHQSARRMTSSDRQALHAGSPRFLHVVLARTSSFRANAGAYIRSTYSLTIRRAENRGATVRIASLTIFEPAVRNAALRRDRKKPARLPLRANGRGRWRRRRRRSVVGGAPPSISQPLVAVEPLGPPAVADAQVRHAVDRGLHAARAAGFERLARLVQPHVAALHEEMRDVQVVVVDERHASAEHRLERATVDLLQMVLADVVGRMRLAGEDDLDRAAPLALRIRASRSAS